MSDGPDKIRQFEIFALRECKPQFTVIETLDNRALFQACARLESRGHLKHVVDRKDYPARTIYEITPAGAQALRDMLGSQENQNGRSEPA